MGIIDDLSEKHSPEREEALLEAIKDSKYEVNFVTIDSFYKDHRATFRVFDDALKIEGVRINVSARLQQQIADHMGCMLMTPKLADLRFAQAKTVLKPHTRWDKTGGRWMSTKEWMKWHSEQIDKDLAEMGYKSGLIDTVGKHWIIDKTLVTRARMPGQAINYGWHYKGNIAGVPKSLPVTYKDMPGVKMIQSMGYFHDMQHQDYSQICVLVTRECNINNHPMDLKDVLADPELCHLASHNGSSHVWRMPTVPDPNSNQVFIPNI